MATKYQPPTTIPERLPAVLKDFTREVLRAQPTDLHAFGAAYFGQLAAQQQQQVIGGSTTTTTRPSSSHQELKPAQAARQQQQQLEDGSEEEEHDGEYLQQ